MSGKVSKNSVKDNAGGSSAAKGNSSTGDINETIRVCIRQRPFLRDHASPGIPLATKEDGALVSSGIESITCAGTGDNAQSTCVYYSAASKIKSTFTFDKIFTPDATQDDIFTEVAHPIIDSSLLGYSGLILAYGPTGSGKTFTMRGNSGSDLNDRGIIPRSIEMILSQKSSNTEVWASYLQIYCENISDLLEVAETAGTNGAENNNLTIRLKSENTNGSAVYVEGLTRYKVTCLDDLWEILSRGDENRSVAATNLNETSSRSHAVLMLSLIIPDDEGTGAAAEGESTVQYREGQLILVDLAGSERAVASEGRSYMRLEEAKAINLSLSSLGNVMSALAEGRSHIPYRDSKLTRLLQGCLGGTSRAAVVVTVLPGEDSCGETLSALRFASRASKVKVSAKISRQRNYETLYKTVLSKLKELEQLPRDSVEGDKQREKDEKIEQQKVEIEVLKLQIAAMQSEIVRFKDSGAASSSLNSNGAESSAASIPDKSQLTASSTSTTTSNQESLSTKHSVEKEQFLETLARFTSKQRSLELKASHLQSEIDESRQALREERERHLRTVTDLRSMHEQHVQQENYYKGRVDELLAELNEKQATIDEQKEQIDDMVARSKVQEMERLFMETIERLSNRVQNLEKKPSFLNSGEASSVPPQTNAFTATVQPQQHSSKQSRIEPGGRIRPSNSSMSGKSIAHSASSTDV